MSKKNLDKLFQEKFKDFEEMPDEKVWDAISTSLDKKKSRKLLPFWWKLGGIAALLAILLAIINPFEDKTSTVPVISDTETTEKENTMTKKEVEIIPLEERSEEENQVANTKNESDETTNSYREEEIQSSKTRVEEKKSNLLTPKAEQAKTPQFANSDFENPIQEKETNMVAENTDTSEKSIESKESGDISDEITTDQNSKGESEKNRLNLPTGQADEKLVIENSNGQVPAQAGNEEHEEEQVAESSKKSIFEEVDKQNEDKEALVEKAKNRWSVGANLAPVYFGSFGEGSPIDPAFSANSKSGDFNMSYGLSVAYGVNEKLSIRTGINKVDFGYDTNEVEFSASLQGSLSGRLNNVNYTASSENVVVESKANSGISFAENKAPTDVIDNSISRNGIMAQEFGYIEVPVELDYALIDTRLGVNLIGGVSTLFLTNNSVALNDSEETIELGEANNLNNVNFSTNVGFGLNYKFTPKIRLHVEPVFKYQLNTFSDTSGSFNPFSIGVYSGLNFRF